MGMSEKTMRERFHAQGKDVYFEFVERIGEGRSAEKFITRCKSCGSSFEAWRDVLRGRCHLSCRECGQRDDGTIIFTRTKEVENILNFYTAGHSVNETAEQFGLTRHQVSNLVKRNHVSNGLNWIDQAQKSNQLRHEEAEQRKLLAKLEREKQKAEIRTAKVEAKIEAKKQLAERQRIEKLLNPPVNKKQERINKRLFDIHQCKVCGRPYTVAQWMEDKGLKFMSNPGYCSTECERITRRKCEHRRDGHRDNHRKRARTHGSEYESGITLKKLVKRDGLRCALCGDICNWDDKEWGYTGPTYPSIDHIIPISKGGGHTWSNVQVAHLICNSNKGDRTEDVREVTA